MKRHDPFDTMKEKAGEVASAALERSKQFMEITRLNLSITAREAEIQKLYAELGEAYYERQGQSPDPAYESCCQKIRKAFRDIEQNEERITKVRRAEDESGDDLDDDDPDDADAGDRDKDEDKTDD
ncbi:MAG: hypothetical protein IKD96_05560 [Oscillospiraceae bacterium]|nr:hypothetical protein [Oscillospiraceae bacterium]